MSTIYEPNVFSNLGDVSYVVLTSPLEQGSPFLLLENYLPASTDLQVTLKT